MLHLLVGANEIVLKQKIIRKTTNKKASRKRKLPTKKTVRKALTMTLALFVPWGSRSSALVKRELHQHGPLI